MRSNLSNMITRLNTLKVRAAYGTVDGLPGMPPTAEEAPFDVSKTALFRVMISDGGWPKGYVPMAANSDLFLHQEIFSRAAK